MTSTFRSDRYDRFYTPEELAEAKSQTWDNLLPFIEILRLEIARFLSCPELPKPPQALEPRDLRLLSRACLLVGKLTNLHIRLHPPLSLISKEIDQAYYAARKQLGILDGPRYNPVLTRLDPDPLDLSPDARTFRPSPPPPNADLLPPTKNPGSDHQKGGGGHLGEAGRGSYPDFSPPPVPPVEEDEPFYSDAWIDAMDKWKREHICNDSLNPPPVPPRRPKSPPKAPGPSPG